ncbi:MAG: hypothetical protein DDG59_01140 [Anaerolineae bacterium]|jgi:hypothetical protein|nr:MAG: hypothetical protein DDG59_01140 [Anaerolineae bacterium]
MVESLDMNIQNEPIKTGLPNIIGSFRKGFDSIANHLYIILFPVILDVFLWLGPHLKITRLIEGLLSAWNEFYSSGSMPNEDALRVGQMVWSTIGERFNLFVFLRTYPVGVFSLMAGVQPVHSPLSEPWIIQASSLGTVLLAWATCSILGILAASIYFSLVAQVSVNGWIDWVDSIKSWLRNGIHLFLLTVFWFTIIAMVALPCSCLISFLTFGNLAAAQLGILVMMGFLIWLLFPLIFSPHGIFVHRADVWNAIKQSIQLTRFTFLQTLLFFVVIFVVGEAFDVIWRLPKETSWMMLIGIAGHGFITSALLATTFVYYRDAKLWVETVMQKLETVSPSS